MLLLPAFTPTPSQADAVLDSLADPAATLLSTARAHNVSVRALTAWLQGPDVLPHVEIINAALAQHARSQSAATLPRVIGFASKALDTFCSLRDPDRTPEAIDRHHRHCQTALRAGWLLYRLARFEAPARHPAQDDGLAPPPGRRPADLDNLASRLNDLTALAAPQSIGHHTPPSSRGSGMADHSATAPTVVTASLAPADLLPRSMPRPSAPGRASTHHIAAAAGMTSGP